jgi:branched-subunit amino acid transport protein AzlD
MSGLIALCIAIVGTAALRWGSVWFFSSHRLPGSVEHVLRGGATAVLASLVASSARESASAGVPAPAVIAAIAGAAVAGRFRGSMVATLGAGLVAGMVTMELVG